MYTFLELWNMRGPPKYQNYILQGEPLVVQASLAEYSRNTSGAGVIVRGCIQLQWVFFLKTQRVFSFHHGWFTSAPTHIALSVQQFLTKSDMTSPCPALPVHPISPWANFFFCFPGWKKSSKRNVLSMWKRWNKKMAEALNGIKRWVPKLFWAVEKKISVDVFHKMESTLWLKFKHIGKNTQFFINKFHWGGLPMYMIFYSIL